MNFSEIIMSIEMGLIYAVVALGIYLTFRVLDAADLSCDGTFALGGASVGICMVQGLDPWLALAIAYLSGSFAGLIAGILQTRFKISALLAGILVAFMLYSINLRVMGNIPNLSLFELNTIFTAHNPLLILSMIGGLLCAGLIFVFMTDFGLALRSLGQNKTLAQANGISIERLTWIGLATANGLVALGGALFAQHQGFADIGSGLGTLVVGLASIILGERLLPYRALSLQLIGCLVGSIMYRLLMSLALHSESLGLESHDLNLITGLLIIAIMRLPRRARC